MGTCKVPRMSERVCSGFLTDYREFDIAMGSRFNKSYSYDVASVLSEHDVSCPGAAYYCEELRIIDDLKFFPGSPAFFTTLLEWVWEAKRAYKDAYMDTDNSELEDALYVCVQDIEEVAALIMKYA